MNLHDPKNQSLVQVLKNTYKLPKTKRLELENAFKEIPWTKKLFYKSIHFEGLI